MYKILEILTWVFIGAAALVLLLGIGGYFKAGDVLLTPRGCSVLSISLLLFAMNFSLLRWLGKKTD